MQSMRKEKRVFFIIHIPKSRISCTVIAYLSYNDRHNDTFNHTHLIHTYTGTVSVIICVIVLVSLYVFVRVCMCVYASVCFIACICVLSFVFLCNLRTKYFFFPSFKP